MDTLSVLTVLWAVVMVAFIALMVYRANLANHETDQLFLNETTPSSVHLENDEVVRRLNKVAPLCKGFGGAAIILSLVVAGMWIAHTIASANA
jgi:hypothetical protein